MENIIKLKWIFLIYNQVNLMTYSNVFSWKNPDTLSEEANNQWPKNVLGLSGIVPIA